MDIQLSLVHFAYTLVRDSGSLVYSAVNPSRHCPPCQCLISGPSGCESLERVLAAAVQGAAGPSWILVAFWVCATLVLGLGVGRLGGRAPPRELQDSDAVIINPHGGRGRGVIRDVPG